MTSAAEESLARCRGATEAYLLAMAVPFPLFTGLSGYNYLHLKKFVFYALATLLWLIILFSEAIRRILRGGRLSRPADSTIYTVVFLFLVVLSTLCSPYCSFFSPGERYEGLCTYMLYGATFLGVRRFACPSERLLAAFACAYSLCCCVALGQLLGQNILGLYPEGMNYYHPYVQETGLFLGTVGNVDVFSVLHGLALPLFVAVLLYGKERKRLLLLGPIALGLCCALWEDVASGLLSLCVTAILFLPMLPVLLRRERTGIGQPWYRYLGGVVVLFAVMLFFYFFPFEHGMAFEIHSALHGELRDEFGSHRILIWRKVLDVVRQHPLLGIGPDSLLYYLDIHFERYSSLLGQTLYRTVDHAHNEYLQLLVSFGFIGVAPLIALVLNDLLRLPENCTDPRKLPLVPCLFCCMLQAFFTIGSCITTPLILIAGALLTGDYNGSEIPDQGYEKDRENGDLSAGNMLSSTRTTRKSSRRWALPNARLHDLRHSYATVSIQAGDD